MRYLERDEVQRWLFRRWLEEQAGVPVYYLDESGVELRLHREYGRALRGTKVYGEVSGKLRRRVNLISAWRAGRLVAPLVLDGPCDREVINAYFTQVLLPAISGPALVVLDNASFHHASQAAELCAARGVELVYLPAYSPDLNPIEHCWATFKRALRKVLPTATDPLETITKTCLAFC
jgi:transposase